MEKAAIDAPLIPFFSSGLVFLLAFSRRCLILGRVILNGLLALLRGNFCKAAGFLCRRREEEGLSP